MEIQEIKNRLTLSKVLNHYHLKPDKNLRLCCPFHPDKTPSLQIYYKTHTAYCFSTNCPTHGKSIDVIDFIMYMDQISKREAILKAKELIGGKTEQLQIEPSRVTLLTKMFTYFKNGVHNSKPAKEYLQKRCLDYLKTEVGYNSGQFHHGQRKDEALIKDCIKYGLLLDLGNKGRTGNPAYKPFGKWCIVFPLKDRGHQIVSLYFRSTLEKKDQRHFYLRNRQGLYPCYPGAGTKRLILTESIIDAATLLEIEEVKSKYKVLALYGTNGLTEEHQLAIKELKELEEVIFFLNGDEAGKKAVAKYAPMLKGELPGVKISHVAIAESEDVNSLVQGHNKEILTYLLESRKSYDIIFSNESSIDMPTAVESPSVENKKSIVIPEVPEVEPPKEKNTSLDTSNPHHIKYKGIAANYQIRGFKLEQLDSLRISLQIVHSTNYEDHRSKLDLYEYKQIKSVANTAGERLSIRSDLIEKDLSSLTNQLENYRDENLHGQQAPSQIKISVPQASASKCIEFMSRPDLVNRFNQLIGKAGITGEEVNRILLFVIATSYKMPDTLHALIQGSSGSGKTRLMQVISDLMPPEDTKRYTRVTDNSFYNQDEYFFVNKLVCFEDLDGLKEDAQLAVRELQSNEILRTSTSIKDANGSIKGGERIVRGPIASLACTTKGEVYEDNVSRCFLIAVDESKAQTMRVINYQNEVAAGLIDKKEQERIKTFIQNCIRLLKSYHVINPYANKIKLPQDAHKIRRLNELYQSFVRQITLLNQYQRKRDEKGRLVSEKADLEVACEILFESIVLKVDELDGSLRQFFEKLKEHIRSKGKEYEFNRFEVRKATGVSKTQQHYYINRLVDLEYLQQNGYANRGYRYKIVQWDNTAAMRARIKDELNNQLMTL